MEISLGKRPSEIDEEDTEWRSRISWTKSHILAIVYYVSEMKDIKSDFSALSSAEICLCQLWDFWNYMLQPHNCSKFARDVVAFTLQLQELFEVPKFRQIPDKDETPGKNELVAAFISFLLQLLDYETELITSYEDRIVCLKKELRFLVTVLGDTSILVTELQQVQNLLAEFEAVASEAGSLVHSFIFTRNGPFKSNTLNEALDALFRHIDLLKDNIIRFLSLLPFIIQGYITPKTLTIDSLFIVDSIIYDLEDLINREDDHVVNVKDQIKILHQELIISQSLLKDIKVARYSQIEELKQPVMNFKDVAYEAEYLINSFLAGDAPPWYLIMRLPDAIYKIKLIGTALQEIKKNYDNTGALKFENDLNEQLSFQVKRNSDVHDIVVGFDDKETSILDQLVGGKEQLQIISIFGMPGLGKTTFAKKLFNHPSIIYHFDKRSWCVVSQTYQRQDLLIQILIGLGNELDNIKNMEEHSLAERIYKILKQGRRYLIVMDDIWSSNVWDDLRRCFPDDRNGSRILLTSRNKDVAPPNGIIYALPSLSNDECWELLEMKVFHNRPCPPKLLSIGKKIAADCNGLPLAVIVIAGILSTMDEEESTWKNVGKRVASYIFSDKTNSTMQILKLSYEHLPDHLKPCFLYFGLFPEDREIPVRRLMWLWIAEGFIRKEEKKIPENVAEEYLMELIDKSLVIVAKRRSDGGVKACVVHDLLRDLCLRIAEEENFLKLMDKNSITYTMHQRLCTYNMILRPIDFNGDIFLPFSYKVRSLLGIDRGISLYAGNMKLLRVLEWGSSFKSGDLVGAKYLVNSRYLVVSRMPASIGSLVNLEFLYVKTGFAEVPISSAIMKMKKLRYLRVEGVAVFDKDCNRSQTNNLEFLAVVLIKTQQDEEMLKCSPNLRKLKCLCATRSLNLRFLTGLESLRMSKLREHCTIEISFPSNIKKLTLYRLLWPWEKMSIIGELPNLQVLKLAHDSFVGERWDTRDGKFQQLRFLKLQELRVAQWNASSNEHFPVLQRLVLDECHNLQEIPSAIGDIDTLQLIQISWCLKSVVESASKIQEEQRDMGNEEFQVIIGAVKEMSDERV